jgi:hypothetical protein
MTETLTSSSGTASRPLLLARARAAIRTRRAAEVELLEAALDWAHAHQVSDPDTAAVWGLPGGAAGTGSLLGERPVPIAGAGCPLVGEFAAMELAAVLDVSHEAALALMGDALDLAHRLPGLWGLVRAGRVSVHLARLAAAESRDLSVGAAAHADRLLVWQPRRLNPTRVARLVREARLYADPDRAVADHDDALAARRVEVVHEQGAPGTSEGFLVLDTADAAAFDATVTSVAASLGAWGDPGGVDVRRARAAGILADPQRALDLITGHDADDEADESVAEEAAFAPAAPPAATIEVRVTDADLLAAGPLGRGGVATSDRLGPVLLDRLAGWLVGARVTIRPVLDLGRDEARDAHDPPAWMAELVRARDEVCVVPGCHRSSARCDLDHIDPYLPADRGGPPGQTRPGNLAPLCRRHHRAKTFGDWAYERMSDGSYRWTTPTARSITVPAPRRRPGPPR